MGILQIGVLGAGIVGTTTALELQKKFRNSQITVLADKFYNETTSNGAAGIFRPGTSFSGSTEEIARQWINYSYEYYTNLLNENCGIKKISGYIFSRSDPSIVKNHFLEQLVPVYRNVTKSELSLCPGGWKYGSFFETLLIESSIFLPWALKKFCDYGGQIEKFSAKGFSELEGKFDIVVNCTGLGAKLLCQDNKLVPVRGQIIKVEAPWLKHFYYGEFDTYIIPGSNGVTLGGSRHYDSSRIEPCKHDGAAILERCISMLPKLSSARQLYTWVGLRPLRDPVRVQAEILPNGLKIVHNYGHGGYGITTAPGTAENAVQLVCDALSSKSRF